MEIAKRRMRMQVRATPDKAPGSFEAVVSTYNLEYSISAWGPWTEKILPGAFKDSIAAHPTIPVYHQHDWTAAPIGSCQPTENDDNLTVSGRLYLGMGDLVARVYQAMLDEALEEWSIGFWALATTVEEDSKMCDQIAKGDLAEASVCLRGANTDTGTLELNNGAPVWIEGNEEARGRELVRVRSLFGDVIDLDEVRRRHLGNQPPRARTAVPTHSTATDDGSWDGPGQVAKLDSPTTLATAKKMFAWYDAAKVEDGEIVKAGCKFPHHEVADGKPGAANVKACQSIISILNGGMGGADIPAGDVQGVYDHAAKHLRDAGVTPADLKTDGADAPGIIDAAAFARAVIDAYKEGLASRADAVGHSHEHVHADGTVHDHQHTHNPASYDHGAADSDVAHTHAHPDGSGDGGQGNDGDGDEDSKRSADIAARLAAAAWGRPLLEAMRESA